MFSRAALAVFALVVAEYFVFAFAAQIFGASTVVWISLAAAVMGFILVRRSFAAMVIAGVQPLQADTRGSPIPSGPTAAQHGLLVVAGVLLVIPGLLSGAVGVALLLPPVRFLLRSRLRQRLDGLISQRLVGPDGRPVSFGNGGSFFGRRDVIDVDLHADGTSSEHSANDDGPTTAPPELH